MAASLDELIKPKLSVQNSNVDLNDRLRERATRPIINSNPIVEVDAALDKNSEAALKANRKNRKTALEKMRKR